MAAREQALTGGTAAPQSVGLSDSQRRALGVLRAEGALFCTGWLVGPRHVVTAAHCFDGEGPELARVDFHVAAASPLTLPVVAVERHPRLDVAVVVLGAPSDAEPFVMNEAVLSSADVGRVVEVAGGGVGTNPELGVSFGAFSLVAVAAERVEIDSEAPRGPCRGDSGGPYLMAFGDELRVVAAESEGATDCLGPNWGTRADVFAPWVKELVARAPLPQSARCEGAGAWCDGAVAWSCRDGWLRARDCGALGADCGALGGVLGEGCLPVACGEVDARGVCRGGKALWCSGGHVAQLDCAARDLGCAWDAASSRQGCVPCEACGGECVELQRDARHCGGCGVRCGPGEQCLGARCVGATADVVTTSLSAGCSTAPVALGWLAAVFGLRRRASNRDRGARS